MRIPEKFLQQLSLITLFSLSLLTSPLVFSKNNNLGGDKLDKYAVRYDDVVYKDKSRMRDGTKINSNSSTDPVGGYRLIDVRIYRPASGAGSGAPLNVPIEPIVYNGSFENQPTVTSTMGFQLDRTWTDNTPLPGPYPLVIMYGGGGNSFNVLRLAEEIASAGFIVAVPTGYGTDTGACPIPAFCTQSAVPRTAQRDARVVIDAAMSGQLGFPNSQILQDTNGPVVACVGGSAGSSVCLQAAAGATTTDPNSLPAETSTETRIRALFVGDIYNTPSATFNNLHLTQALAMVASGLRSNWPADFPLYNNASKRVYYELIGREHRGADLSSNILCDSLAEYIRVYSTHVNTHRDDVSVGGVPNVMLGPSFAHCDQSSLTGINSLPVVLPSNLSELLPFTPLSGLLDDKNGDMVKMTNYYVINFLRGILNNDLDALHAATTPSFPVVLNDIYVDSVPGTPAHNFNLQNKKISIQLASAGNQLKTTIENRNGPILDPTRVAGTFSLFGDIPWNENIAHVVLPFAFPFQKGNLINATNTVEVNSNGYILPESNMLIIDSPYEAKRMQNWFADHGSTTIACFGNNLLSGQLGQGPNGKVWVSSTPQRVQFTWYQVQSTDFPNMTISAQCSIYPDGTVTFEYDNSVPAVIPAVAGSNGSIIVGMSSGRLHVNPSGKYIQEKNPRIITFSDVLNGQSSIGANAVYEVFTREVPASP